MLFIDRFSQVTNHPVVKGAGPVSIVGVGGHEDRWNCVARINEALVEFDPGHRRHVDIGDYAGRLGEAGRREEIGRR